MKKKHHWSWVREIYDKDGPAPPLWQTIIIWAVFLVFVLRIAWIIWME